MNDAVAYEKDGTEALSAQTEIGRLLVRGGGEHLEVDWDAGTKVTPMGSVVFLAQYLKTGGLLDRLCEGTPLAYGSNNAPKARDVLGTAVLLVFRVDRLSSKVRDLKARLAELDGERTELESRQERLSLPAMGREFLRRTLDDF